MHDGQPGARKVSIGVIGKGKSTAAGFLSSTAGVGEIIRRDWVGSAQGGEVPGRRARVDSGERGVRAPERIPLCVDGMGGRDRLASSGEAGGSGGSGGSEKGGERLAGGGKEEEQEAAGSHEVVRKTCFGCKGGEEGGDLGELTACAHKQCQKWYHAKCFGNFHRDLTFKTRYGLMECPLHNCAACFDRQLRSGGGRQWNLVCCVGCPTAYHVAHIPPTADAATYPPTEDGGLVCASCREDGVVWRMSTSGKRQGREGQAGGAGDKGTRSSNGRGGGSASHANGNGGSSGGGGARAGEGGEGAAGRAQRSTSGVARVKVEGGDRGAGGGVEGRSGRGWPELTGIPFLSSPFRLPAEVLEVEEAHESEPGFSVSECDEIERLSYSGVKPPKGREPVEFVSLMNQQAGDNAGDGTGASPATAGADRAVVPDVKCCFGTCGTTGNCGAKCACRMAGTSCAEGCCTHDACTNPPLGMRPVPRLRVFRTDDGRGFGLKTRDAIDGDDFVIEVLGEVVSKRTASLRHFQYTSARDSGKGTEALPIYMSVLEEGRVLDATHKGNESRFLNHSCRPNCALVKLRAHPGADAEASAKGEARLAVFTLRDIEAGEELTVSYDWRGLNFLAAEVERPCLCSPGCTGKLAGPPAKGVSPKASPKASGSTGRGNASGTRPSRATAKEEPSVKKEDPGARRQPKRSPSPAPSSQAGSSQSQRPDSKRDRQGASAKGPKAAPGDPRGPGFKAASGVMADFKTGMAAEKEMPAKKRRLHAAVARVDRRDSLQGKALNDLCDILTNGAPPSPFHHQNGSDRRKPASERRSPLPPRENQTPEERNLKRALTLLLREELVTEQERLRATNLPGRFRGFVT